ncbi:thioesterase family protein [Exiguobacterium sp. s193]|uniref:acyl-CoA thioesterase n=1 Tax=Exiguobacterium sp. s193 TaxID=2751207 RepID=UPI001BE9ADF1|nr:thioesterase family protein [Exiguobacterium sp. s193]
MHTIEIPVRYAETDMMGIVYHSNYLVYLEIARTELIKSLGLDYKEMEEEGYVSPVTNVNLDYKRSLTYGDTATVTVWIDHYDGLRTIYGYEVKNADGQLAVAAKTTHVVVKKENFRPIRLPKVFPNWHAIYEQMSAEDARLVSN